MNYPMIGVVLDVRYRDDDTNLSKRMVGTEEGGTRVEAMVLIVQGKGEPWFVLPNCMILQGKTSAPNPRFSGPDYSEAYPNPSLPHEVDNVLSSNLRTVDPLHLTGDWVVVSFIGANVNNPLIMGWLPHPLSRAEPAKREDGQRFRWRHRGTSVEADDDGNVTLTHRRGHSVRIENGTVEVQHRASGDADAVTSITISPSGALTISAQGKVVIDSEADDIEIGDTGLDNLATKAFVEDLYDNHTHQTNTGSTIQPSPLFQSGTALTKSFTEEVKGA